MKVKEYILHSLWIQVPSKEDTNCPPQNRTLSVHSEQRILGSIGPSCILYITQLYQLSLKNLQAPFLFTIEFWHDIDWNNDEVQVPGCFLHHPTIQLGYIVFFIPYTPRKWTAKRTSKSPNLKKEKHLNQPPIWGFLVNFPGCLGRGVSLGVDVTFDTQYIKP